MSDSNSTQTVPQSRLDAKQNQIRVLLICPPESNDSSYPLHCVRETVSLDDTEDLEERALSSPSQPTTRQDAYLTTQSLWSDNHNLTRLEDSKQDTKIEVPQNRFRWGNFVALSYCWGPPGDQEVIYIDGLAVTVQKALASALRALRDKTLIRQGVKVWADAICINQTDLIERNEHVLRIRHVYQAALQVVCWLGDESDDSSSAIRLASQVSAKWIESGADRMSFSLHESPDLLKPQQWLALGRLVNRPYWSRLWIKQELATGDFDTPLLCGRDTISWGQLHDTIWSAAYSNLAYVEELVRQSSTGDSSMSLSSSDDPLRRKQIYQLGVLQYKLRDAKDATERDASLMHRLPAILDLSRSCAATDYRDKVYGISSLLPSAITSKLEVDYKISIQQVYLSFAKSTIESTHRLEILDHCCWREGQEGPSWVPDWRTAYTRIWVGIKRKMPYDACAGTSASVRFSEDGASIHVAGGILDTIDGLGGVSNEEQPPTILDQIIQPQQYAGQTPVDTTKLRDSLWRTITANINTNGEPAPHAFNNVLDLLGNDTKTPDSNSNSLTDEFALSGLKYLQNFIKHSGDLLIGGIPLNTCLHANPDSKLIKPRRLDMEQALDRIFRCTQHRRIAVTRKGTLCMVPNGSRVGDVVVVLWGGALPVVLRGVGDAGWIVVGTYYAHGFMNGEGVEMVEGGLVAREEFRIV